MLSKADRAVLLLTRPAAQSERFAHEALERLADDLSLSGAGHDAEAETRPGLRVVISPVLEIVPRRLLLRPFDYAGLIFTSENGVAAFAEDAPAQAYGLPVWSVGNRTAEAARRAGFGTVFSAADEGGDAEALLRLLLETRPEGPLLHLRGAHARGDLPPRLSAAGLPCTAAIVYDQLARPLSPEALRVLEATEPVLLPLFSPRTATLCAEGAAGAQAPLYPVAISNAAARAWQALRPEAPVVSAHPNSAAMLDALSGIIAGNRG